MTSVLNRSTILWAVGVLQPVSVTELRYYFETVLTDAGATPSGDDLFAFLREAAEAGQVIRAAQKPSLYSLTAQGNHYLTRAQRETRDRERIFLLRDSWSNRIVKSREEPTLGLGGAAPPQLTRSIIEGSGANKVGSEKPRSRPYWPRHSRQFIETTGPMSPSRDSDLELLSFNTMSDVENARGGKEKQPPKADFISIALMLGVSPQLLNHMAVRPERHYRSFALQKRTGGSRQIEAPRVFLKVVQKFIADYILWELPVHPAVHSFRFNQSTLSNAQCHVRQSWVGNIDIENFFGSITEASLEKFLRKNGFDESSSKAIARLTTYHGRLPQGAPSSPILSNAILFGFDAAMASYCGDHGLSYSRYADDITVSGPAKYPVQLALDYARVCLSRDFRLSLNTEKTRIASSNSQQRVTGIVVNEVALPPRSLRRNVRAAAFNALRQPVQDAEAVAKLTGYLNYFRSFPDFRDNLECQKLSEMVHAVVSRLNAQNRS